MLDWVPLKTSHAETRYKKEKGQEGIHIATCKYLPIKIISVAIILSYEHIFYMLHHSLPSSTVYLLQHKDTLSVKSIPYFLSFMQIVPMMEIRFLSVRPQNKNTLS